MFNLIMKGLLATLHYTTLAYSIWYRRSPPFPSLPAQLRGTEGLGLDPSKRSICSSSSAGQGHMTGQGGRGAEAEPEPAWAGCCDRFLHVLIAIRRPRRASWCRGAGAAQPIARSSVAWESEDGSPQAPEDFQASPPYCRPDQAEAEEEVTLRWHSGVAVCESAGSESGLEVSAGHPIQSVGRCCVRWRLVDRVRPNQLRRRSGLRGQRVTGRGREDDRERRRAAVDLLGDRRAGR